MYQQSVRSKNLGRLWLAYISMDMLQIGALVLLGGLVEAEWAILHDTIHLC